MRLRIALMCIELTCLGCSAEPGTGIPLVNATVLVFDAAPGVALNVEFARYTTTNFYQVKPGDSTCIAVPAAPDSLALLLQQPFASDSVYPWHARTDSMLVVRLGSDTTLSIAAASEPCTP